MIKYKFTYGNECIVILIQFAYFLIAFLVFNFGQAWQNTITSSPVFAWSTFTLPPTYWGVGHINSGFVAFMFNGFEQFFTVIAGIILGAFIFQGVVENARASLALRIAIQDLFMSITGGDGPGLLAACAHFMKAEKGVMAKRLVIVIICGLLNFLGVQGVQSLQNTAACWQPKPGHGTQEDISCLFISGNNNGTDNIYKTFAEVPTYQPLLYYDLLNLNATMENEGFISFIAANCWGKLPDNTSHVVGLCEGTQVTCTPYTGPFNVNATALKITPVQSNPPASDTTAYPFLYDDAGVFILQHGKFSQVAKVWNLTVGVVVPVIPNTTVAANSLNITDGHAGYENIDPSSPAHLGDGWYTMTDYSVTGALFNRSFWMGECSISFWRDNQTTFFPQNQSVQFDPSDPEILVDNVVWTLHPINETSADAPAVICEDEGITQAWHGLQYPTENVTINTFTNPLTEQLISHTYHSLLSSLRSGTSNTTVQGTLSTTAFPYHYTWQEPEMCAVITLWPYLLLPLWMIPILFYNLRQLIRTRRERYARSVIRDQCLTAEGLIHVYAMYARMEKNIDRLPRSAKRHALFALYEKIETEVRHDSEDVYWDAPEGPDGMPTGPEARKDEDVMYGQPESAYPSYPMAPVSPAYAPLMYTSPMQSPPFPRGGQYGTSTSAMQEPLLGGESGYYDSAGVYHHQY
ncbi:hypothetical protein YB2330_000590 [Saitoella coloradoensis]